MRCRISCLALIVLALSGWAPLPDEMPTLQDMQIVGRVLHFRNAVAPGGLIVVIVYNAADARSHDEAAALSALLDHGLVVGDLVLKPCLVEQAQLGRITGYGAILTTVGVDQQRLGVVLKQRQVPCLTRHPEQVEHGSCIVAIGSIPRVSIVVNERNAVLDGVQFATAFRMMVQEI